jgi:hypothetical protein
MSTLLDAEIVNAIVLAAVLEADLGSHRKIGWFRTVVIGARALFSYGANHWFSHQLGSWLTTNSIPSAAITDGLIFMAVAMLLTRTAGLRLRSHSLPGAGTAPVVPSSDYVQV